MRKPKYWDTMFAVNVLNAYDAGELDLFSTTEWETKYNGGRRPVPSLGAMEILEYHMNTGKDMRASKTA